MATNTNGSSRATRLNPNLSIGNQINNQGNNTTPKDSVVKPKPTFSKQVDESKITGGVYEPVLITESCDLPSKGILYGGELGSTLELRAMTTLEERMRLSGENFWSTMIAILNRCKVNTDFDMKNLVDFDFLAVLVKLRIISYGNNYKAQSRCLKCGKDQIVNVNLDELKVTKLEDDFVEPFEIGPLPVSGDVLGCRFLRLYDHVAISKESESWAREHPNDKFNNPEYTRTMERTIVTINGAKLNDIQKRHYVETMVGADSSVFHDKIENMFYGIHRLGTSKCEEKDCGSPVLYQIAPSESFFRATPLDNK